MRYVRRIRWGLITLDARFAQWWRNSAHRDLGAILTSTLHALRDPLRCERWLEMWDDMLDAGESLRDALTNAPLRGGLGRKFRRVWVKFTREVPIRFDLHDESDVVERYVFDEEAPLSPPRIIKKNEPARG